MIRKGLRCPKCDASIDSQKVSVGSSFHCEFCSESLIVRSPYGNLLMGTSVLLAGLLSFGFGMRGLRLAAAVFLGWIPIYYIARVCLNFIVPAQVSRRSPENETIQPNLGPDEEKSKGHG